MLNPILASTLSQQTWLRHGFFTREGGVSEGIYAGLNVGFGSSDDRGAITENRRRVAQHLGLEGAPLNTLHQVHSATALVIDAPLPTPAPQADALVTRTPGVIIGALAADCTPVLFADPVAKVVAAAHAGWRGAVGGVLEAAISKMETLGARRDRILAAIGPTISQLNYEVGPEFADQLLARSADNARFFARPGPDSRAHFDLPAFVAAQLARCGLAATERQAPCTYANESMLFSFRRATHRKELDYGRQISAIVMI